jgi:beta-RFAP synthase
MTQIRIQTPSRLHFGLFGWGAQAARQFGGVGLMVEDPGIEILASPAKEWSFHGPLAHRVSVLVEGLRELHCEGVPDLGDLPGAKVEIVRTPREHVGLGVGTQLSLSVVQSALGLSGYDNLTLETLARLSGRGRRSGIGLHGYLHGGLIVDGGRGQRTQLPPMVARAEFPHDWSVLIVQSPGPPGRHGPEEVEAFSDLPPPPERITEHLCRVALLGVLPAVMERDLAAFGAAVSELQHHVGAAFSAIQGGAYSSPRSDAIIAELMRSRLVGAGQSSWGPTLYAFGLVSESERAMLTSRLVNQFSLHPSDLIWTRAANRGAITSRSDD